MIRLLIGLVFLFSVSISEAQNYSFITYSASDGLPQSQVNSITQDSSGYLWIATFGGLAKFNGQQFTDFGKSDGLLNNRTVHLDYINETLFVGHDIGISYTCASDSFCNVSFPETSSPANVSGVVLFEDQLIVTTNGAGLFLLDLEKESLTPVEHSPKRIREVIVVDDRIYFATRNGLFYSNDLNRFQQLSNTEDFSFSSILSRDKEIYGTTYGGLLLKISASGKLDTLVDRENDPFRSVLIDDEGRIWVNSRNGVLIKKDEELIQLSESTGLPINDINIVFNDLEGNIWLGTGGKGLSRFTGEIFTHYKAPDFIPSDIVISLIKDSRNNMWLSTYDKGVFLKSPGKEAVFIDQITSSVWTIDQSESHLVFGSNYGLHVYDYEKWVSFYEEDGLSSNRISGVKKVNDSVFLIGTSKGIEWLNVKSGQISSMLEEGRQLSNVRDFAIKGDTIYIAAQSGVFTYAKESLNQMYQFDAGINCISIDDFNNLWLGTENGLFISDGAKLSQRTLDEENSNDYVNFIRKIDDAMFVGTNSGLFEINTRNSEIYRYDVNKGLVNLETNLNASMFDNETKELWFGTASGLMKMDYVNRKKLFESAAPKIKLTSVIINFETISHIGEYSGAIQKKDLRIPFKDNNIAFEFDGIYLSNPGALRYQYFLEGFSDTWSPLMKNPDINFTNLPPGKFTLRLRAFNEVGDVSKEWKTNFEILPPFYMTWWFYSLIAILFIILLFAVDRIRLNRLARKNYRMKLEFENKLSKLEQQSLNASMNRHFIFNSLNSIQYYINSSDKTSANKYLSRFAKLIRKNLDSSHRKDGMVALSDEIDRLQLYLDLESMRFKDKFDYNFEIEPNVEIEMLKVPAMFLQPFVENSIIHGILPLKDRKGLIQIRVRDHLDHIRIEIKDNGVGIDYSVREKREQGDHESQGMLITKGRIELLQKISARSIEMIGPHQIKGNDSSINGTIVIFKLVKQYLE